MRYNGKPHKGPFTLLVEIYSEVPPEMLSQINAFPSVEAGGKYIGRLKKEFKAKGKKWADQLEDNSIEIIHFIDPGPKAKRSAVELLPDGEYQERVFRAIEAQHPDVEHLGSWHSHHPNGLRELSAGDIRGYFETVNEPNYNLDLFVATLITSKEGFASARHFLFIRGESDYYECSPGSVKVVSKKNPYDLILKTFRRAPSFHKVERQKCDSPSTPSHWYQTPEGKQTLKEDREFFTDLADGFKSLKRGDTLIWRGTINLSSNLYEVTYEYPPDFLQSPSSIEIRSVHNPSFSIKCTLYPIANRKRLMNNMFQLIREFDKTVESNS